MFLEACSGMYPDRNLFQESELPAPSSSEWVAPAAGRGDHEAGWWDPIKNQCTCGRGPLLPSGASACDLLAVL